MIVRDITSTEQKSEQEAFQMATLAKEYTDIKDIKHKVEHLFISDIDQNSKEQILEELLHVLVKPKRHIPA